ncbi:MAG: GNAT family N-acetyltransferase [Provencibacterium sp.]|jgi:predicted acetyltransferase|nr:GNAT family N-acetyltransferase [Provencibacterium sp.]
MLKLIRMDYSYRRPLEEMMEEWHAAGETIVPYSIRRKDYRDFESYLAGFDEEERGAGGWVPGTTFFGLDTDRDILVGAVNVRRRLNPSLLLDGGHIGDGVRPSERRKGYATALIGLALEFCRSIGLGRVLMTCDRENVGSAKSILRNGGVLENEWEKENGAVVQRYWIEL